MYQIATLNKISPVGLERFDSNYSFTSDVNEADGIMVRSQDMLSMEFSDKLLAIARAGAGVNNIPVDRCAEEGIVVFNTPGANANAVKELVIAGMLLAARNLPDSLKWAGTLTEPGIEDVSKAVEKGKGQFAGTELLGKTLGVIGLGAIGVSVANTAAHLGMKVVGYDPFITLHSAHELDPNIPVVADLSDLLPQCDYITIHVPAVEGTKGMINSKRFEEMKDGVVFLNFARDKLVNDDNLIGALNSGKVRKYVTDFPNEKVIGRAGVICIPHLGASTEEAEDNCAAMAANELMDYIENGNIRNSVNFPVCSLGPVRKNQGTRICIMNKSTASILSTITNKLADLNINISNMNTRSMGDFTYTLIDVDCDVDEAALNKSLKAEEIIKLRVIK